jgi:hypothetical protein
MPIHECDPWREQYFQGVACPDEVIIPTDDPDAWQLYPAHRWIYDKLAVALSQGLQAAPFGVMPARFPVFSKPITNLLGMGVGSRAILSPDDYAAAQTAGHFWSTLLTGAHVSSDAALIDGNTVWWRHTTGAPGPGGTFDHWHMPDIEAWCGAWSRKHLTGYTGMVNFETIGSRIIEAHLRFADQWPDLYGPGWIDAVVRLYSNAVWDYPDTDRVPGFSVVLFAPNGPRYRHPPDAVLEHVRAIGGVRSVQITFHQDKDPAGHAMPPGGFRLAVVNAVTLAAGRAARDHLRRAMPAL